MRHVHAVSPCPKDNNRSILYSVCCKCNADGCICFSNPNIKTPMTRPRCHNACKSSAKHTHVIIIIILTRNFFILTNTKPHKSYAPPFSHPLTISSQTSHHLANLLGNTASGFFHFLSTTSSRARRRYLIATAVRRLSSWKRRRAPSIDATPAVGWNEIVAPARRSRGRGGAAVREAAL
jgi:hypothetical protein